MDNWVLLNDEEYDKVWDEFYEKFEFKPHTTHFPSFEVFSPYITYDISKCFLGEEMMTDEDESLILAAFKDCTRERDMIYALDWQHECYWVNPHLGIENLSRFTIPLFPDGDYYFFLEKDFKWGYLAHPWEQSITIFGDKLVKELEGRQPQCFKRVLRKG